MSVDARNVLSPHTEEMNMMLAENIDSILGSSSAKIEKSMGRLSLVRFIPKCILGPLLMTSRKFVS